jgi:hypothetical protein
MLYIGFYAVVSIYTSIPICLHVESTTVKVSKRTARKLSSLQRSLKTKSLDETVDLLVKQHRRELLKEAFGIDRRKIRPFSEDDRGEDSS